MPYFDPTHPDNRPDRPNLLVRGFLAVLLIFAVLLLAFVTASVVYDIWRVVHHG